MSQNIVNFLSRVINRFKRIVVQTCPRFYMYVETCTIHASTYSFMNRTQSQFWLPLPLCLPPCILLVLCLSLSLAAWGDFLTVVCDRTYENVLQYPFYVITSVRPCRQLCQNVWQRFAPSLCQCVCVCVCVLVSFLVAALLFLLLLYATLCV